MKIQQEKRTTWSSTIKAINNTEVPYPKEKALHQFLEEQASLYPHNIAIKDKGEVLTYEALNERANQLARHLRDSGVRIGQTIGICMKRSITFLVSIYAVMKAGAAYVPIGAEYPAERQAYMIADSKAVAVLVGGNVEVGPGNARVIRADQIDYITQSGDNLNLPIAATELAYIIYTSGSTGRPKGVMIEHHSVVNRMLWMLKEYQITSADKVLQKTPITFDVSVWELLIPAFTGCTLCLYEEGEEGNADYLVRTMEQEQVTLCHFVPSMFGAFLGYVKHRGYAKKLASVRDIFCSGESLDYTLVEQYNELLYKENGTRLHNLYGPTEAAIEVTFFPCTGYENKDKLIPIGTPISNVRIYILDEAGKQCKKGEVGELYIAGTCVGRGYIGLQTLTAEKFVTDIEDDESLMYRSGDLGYYNEENVIQYVGRKDQQIKIRGFRIEPREIECVMLQHEAVEEAIVCGLDNRGSKSLLAFYKCKQPLLAEELKRYLDTKLPGYMVPQQYQSIRCVPLTTSGKADRVALLAMYGEQEKNTVPDEKGNHVEKKVMAIICQLLGESMAGHMTLDDRLEETVVDSITFIEILIALEEAFDFEFETDKLAYRYLRNIRQISSYIETRITTSKG